ncbi:phosphoheptose isomerase [Polynucleobacter yangtzensis]|uniref:Phosphoheptose isomerase n=1 Tax=Polynucleobacter yangtzensis TaxID=1743159 RepID=A0A9C7CZC1_9BURK|nr:SIS domain-containing protein [Polynucleobacter yangtzensis]BDT76547.1 phosphoheptose isomerase [Polynucleobacter yangtzensis]
MHDILDAEKLIKKYIQESIDTKRAILGNQKLMAQISELSNKCTASLLSGSKIIFAGNGGSFADAQHLAAEFISKFMLDRPPLPSLALSANSSVMSAIGNDYGYEEVFARELEAVAMPGDIFIPISTSGNSPNILAAVKKANELDIVVVALAGQSGGALFSMCECLCIPSIDTARIQESHIMVGHIVCGLVEQAIFKSKKL